jgi:hypothetical protein
MANYAIPISQPNASTEQMNPAGMKRPVHAENRPEHAFQGLAREKRDEQADQQRQVSVQRAAIFMDDVHVASSRALMAQANHPSMPDGDAEPVVSHRT